MFTIFKFRIVTPEGIKVEEDVEYAEFKSIEGGMGTLTNRLPIIVRLRIAPVRIKKSENIYKTFAVHGGVLQMTGNEMTIVTTAAERPEDIDVQAARRALERAQEELRITEDKFKRMKLETRIQKNLLRVNVSNER
ncbi:ATP synthase F1 subunit epsilon [Defluviitoga tunisiensis]|uniref:ATP synthase epsilon chain n=1 Tax=Defluviitoga tunisiensis TaxID=1006576 RepID=A0A0C7NZT7_DEFTU|nr:ATP synthase F1 subunit epsilon [Defluviitoga tunisiensis]CEP77530.1 F0F1-type ATP synthase, epsilon subunit [Defluviitoga tunisiensis]